MSGYIRKTDNKTYHSEWNKAMWNGITKDPHSCTGAAGLQPVFHCAAPVPQGTELDGESVNPPKRNSVLVTTVDIVFQILVFCKCYFAQLTSGNGLQFLLLPSLKLK